MFPLTIKRRGLHRACTLEGGNLGDPLKSLPTKDENQPFKIRRKPFLAGSPKSAKNKLIFSGKGKKFGPLKLNG